MQTCACDPASPQILTKVTRQEEAQKGKEKGIEEALQVKLRVLFSLAEDGLVIAQAQLEDVLQRRPSDPHYPTPSTLHIPLHPLWVICTHGEG